MTNAYLDLDNFKWVNDNHGHSVGDTLLINIARNAKSNLRISDFFARLGGDEFAVLLPDTDEKSARIALHKLQGKLLEEMNKHNWPVTFSIGTVTCHDIPKSVDELIKQADNLMYSVKNHGKNSIEFSIYRST